MGLTFREAERLLYERDEVMGLVAEITWPRSRGFVALKRQKGHSSHVENAVIYRRAIRDVARLLDRALTGADKRERVLLALRYGEARLTWEQIDGLQIEGLSASSARRVRNSLIGRVQASFAGAQPDLLRRFWHARDLIR